MAQGKDFYAVLGVSEKATADEIKKQYRRLAKQHHPDSNKGDVRSGERFKEISEAYNVLGDVKKRAQYDEMRRLGRFSEAQAQAWLQAMTQAFPDVEPGDRLLGIYLPGQGARFLANGRLTGEVMDTEFAQLFFGIWLSDKTSEPCLRQALLGQTVASSN